jgi:glycosyltransferase involved in cell wall biosynthesis
MKIALINPAPHYTGVGKYALNLFRQLKDKTNIDYYYLNFEEKKLDRHTRNTHTSAPVKTRFKRRFLFNIAAVRLIPKTYDLYHVSTQDFSFANVHPKIITCHDIIRRFYPRNFADYLQQFVIYSGLKNAQHILADSQNTKKDLITHLKTRPEKTTVVPLGVDSVFKPLQKKTLDKIREKYHLPNKKFILHISSEEPRKNYGPLLKAFKQIAEKFPDHYILKVGNAYPLYIKKHERLIRQLKLQARVIRIPTVPEEDLPAFYSMADVFVLPSSYEGFGLPLLEAMACGCPTIAYNTSSIPEIAGKASMLTAEGDIEQLTNALKNVLTNKKARSTLRAQGLKQAAQFTWKSCATQTLQVYKRCAA